MVFTRADMRLPSAAFKALGPFASNLFQGGDGRLELDPEGVSPSLRFLPRELIGSGVEAPV